MSRSIVLVVALALGLLAAAVASAQMVAVKTGAWETTTTSRVLPKPLVVKECVAKADLAQLTSGPDKDDDDECKYVKPPTVAGNKWIADRNCNDGRTVHAEFTADTQEKVSGTITSAAPKGGPTIRIDVAARWLGASCAGIK